MASQFSGTAGRNAAVWQANQAGDLLTRLQEVYGPGFADIIAGLEGGFGKAGKTLDAGIKKETGTYKQYGEAARDELRQGGTAAQGYLDQAIGTLNQRFGEATGVGREASDVWQPLIDRNMAGFDVMSDALGVNGPEGQERARQTFQAGPGYQWQVDQATDAAARSGNARGMGYSGNVTDAITRLGSNLANQEFQQWIENLQPYQTGAHAATAGQSGALQQLADTYGQWGTSVAGVQQDQSNQSYQTGQDVAESYAHQGDKIGGAQGTYYTNKAALPVAQATSIGNVKTAGMGAQADALTRFYDTFTGAGQQGFQSGQDARKNTTAAIMGAIDLATKAIGGAWNTPTSFGDKGQTQGTAGSDFIKRIFPS